MRDRNYSTIVSVEVEDDVLAVAFANGDIARIELHALTPEQAPVQNIQWRDAQIQADGMYIRIPAEPDDLEIPWDIIRNLSDIQFAQRMAALAEEQARQVGARLRELRLKRGLTQTQVSAMAGIQQANLSRIEHGRFDVSTSTLWKLLSAMGYSPSDLAPRWKSFRADAMGR